MLLSSQCEPAFTCQVVSRTSSGSRQGFGKVLSHSVSGILGLRAALFIGKDEWFLHRILENRCLGLQTSFQTKVPSTYPRLRASKSLLSLKPALRPCCHRSTEDVSLLDQARKQPFHASIGGRSLHQGWISAESAERNQRKQHAEPARI